MEISEEPFFEVSRHDSMRHLSNWRHGIQDPPRKLSVKERMARLISYTISELRTCQNCCGTTLGCFNLRHFFSELGDVGI